MKTYRQFISECNSVLNEQPSSTFLGFSKRLGSGVGSNNVGVNASVSGGGSSPGSTQYRAAGGVERGEFSGQGNRISRGIDSALSNYKSGTNTANTSTSTISKGTRGSLSANISGSSGGKPKPAAPVAAKPKPKSSSTAKPKPTSKVNNSKPQFTTKNYSHADPKVNARLQSDPKLLNRAVTFANRAAETGRTRSSNFYNNALINGKAVNQAQATMTAQSRQMAGKNAVAGLGFKYGDSSHKNDRQAHNNQFKQFNRTQ